MEPHKYLKESARTDLPDYKTVLDRIGKDNCPILHAAMGLVTESAEIMDAIKKNLMYGKPLDKTNLAEESGDVIWYLAIILREIDMSFEEIFDMNIAKLKARYPQQFTSEKALNRDLKTERKVMNGFTNAPRISLDETL